MSPRSCATVRTISPVSDVFLVRKPSSSALSQINTFPLFAQLYSNKLGFLMATVEYALARDDVGPEFRTYLQGLKL